MQATRPTSKHPRDDEIPELEPPNKKLQDADLAALKTIQEAFETGIKRLEEIRNQQTLSLHEREIRVVRGAEKIDEKLKKQWRSTQEQMDHPLDAPVSFEYHPVPPEIFRRIEAPHAGPDWMDSSYATLQVDQYEVGICCHQNVRPYMEDRYLAISFEVQIQQTTYPVYLFGLLDGHGGANSAEYVRDHLPEHLRKNLVKFNPEKLSDEGIWNALKLGCVETNQALLKAFPHDRSGTTASLAMILDGNLWTANIGDSRIVLNLNGRAIQATEDAKPGDFKYWLTILNRGGHVAQTEDLQRVGGVLSVARSFGDFHVKGVSARPKNLKIPLTDLPANSTAVLASDGLFDVATTRQVVQIVNEHPSQSPTLLAQSICYAAMKAGSLDNITVLVIPIRK